jgi:hypothetical protein
VCWFSGEEFNREVAREVGRATNAIIRKTAAAPDCGNIAFDNNALGAIAKYLFIWMVTRLFGCGTFHSNGGYKRPTSHYRGDFEVGWHTHKRRRNVKMFHIRKIRSTALASAVLCCFAAALPLTPPVEG